MRRLLRDPVFHFALAGLALFFAFVVIQGGDAGDDELITVSQAQQLQLAAAFSRVWRRPPSEVELKNLVDDWVREEIANREAIAMGLARDDLIIRRRLRQKYEAFMDQVATAVEPTAEELQDWYESHGEDYLQEPRYSFQQVYFSSDRREDAAMDAQQALDQLSRQGPAAAADLGDALALPRTFDDRRETEIAGRLGTDFAKSLADSPLNTWSGPVSSAYGEHLVFLSGRSEARLPELAEVREEVLRDWRDAQLRDARNTVYENLLDRYSVVLEPSASPES